MKWKGLLIVDGSDGNSNTKSVGRDMMKATINGNQLETANMQRKRLRHSTGCIQMPLTPLDHHKKEGNVLEERMSSRTMTLSGGVML